MSKIPDDLLYTQEHEWIRREGDDVVVVGITDHAQAQLGDVVFVEMPDVDATVTQGESFGTVESVKAVSDLYAPVSGTVLDRNTNLETAPEGVNSDPYGDGWMIKLQLSDVDQLDALMSPQAYASHVAA